MARFEGLRSTSSAFAAALLLFSAGLGQAQTTVSDSAALFGSVGSVDDISLSPDGTAIAFISPSPTGGNDLFVVGTAEGAVPQRIMRASGDPEFFSWCGWENAKRLLCEIAGHEKGQGRDVNSFRRLMALDPDGKNLNVVGPEGKYAFAGSHLIDWLPAEDDRIMLWHPSNRVVTISTRNEDEKTVEAPRTYAVNYLSDETGKLRVLVSNASSESGMIDGKNRYFSRPASGGSWRNLSVYDISARDGFRPVAIEHGADRVFGFGRVNGRVALQRMELQGAVDAETIFSHPEVDVSGTLRIGQSGRVVGVAYSTDRPHAHYFDPRIKALAAQLEKALGARTVRLIDATRDEKTFLVWAGSDTDPGHYYLFDTALKSLRPLLADRPMLEGAKLSEVRPIKYPAADGTEIPAYLTLPPGKVSAAGLPAVVMPHGGPSARDEWGFDWLAQFLAQRGFAVLQPNFRGSTGYGDEWYQRNGFQSWRTSVGDVNDAGRWLLSQDVPAAKLSIVGWSYGGYAALQSGVIAPDLFRSIVAIAPVTDLAQLRQEESRYTTARIQRDFIGTGPHLREGSPAQNAAQFKAPVLLFHGTIDQNVEPTQSKTMVRELQKAGRAVELVEYPGLAHDLGSSSARIDMLKRIEAFLPK